MNYKNPDFYRRSENFFPKKDNSAFLRRALSKKYKEDNNKNFDIQDEINNEEELSEENNVINNNKYTNTKKMNSKANYNKNFFQTYNTHQHNLNNRGAFYTKKKNENKNSQALLERMKNDNRNKYNVNKYFTTNIGDDNVYEEFIINYNPGMSPNENKQSNTIDRKKPYININNMNNTKNKIYNRVSLNNGIYKVDKKSFNDLYRDNNNTKEKIEYFNSTYHPNHPYQKRKILDFKEKEPIENGMPDRIKKELYFKNNRNNLTNYNFFDKRLKKNDYNYNFNTYNIGKNNYDRNYNYSKDNLNNYNNNTFENNIQYNITQKDFNNKSNKYLIQRKDNKNIEQKINLFLEHFSEYCIQYYNRIIKQLFSYLKKYSKISSKKYNIITHKRIPIDKTNINNFKNTKNNLIPKTNTKSNYRNNITKIKPVTNTEEKSDEKKNERIPYHKSTDLVIDRIRYNNQSKSPDKKNNFEMFRDIKELSKKYEAINSRKSRQSFNGHLKKGNDLSFDADSVKRSKEKEKWEKTLEKEREMKKNKEKEKKENKKDLIYIQNNNEIFDNKNKNNIRNKYKKLNNNKNKNNKNQMIIVKKLQTKDKKIHINIKYLNNYVTNNTRGKYFFNNKKYKNLQKNNAFNITLFGTKNKNKKIKNENNSNNGNKKLASIKEEKENKIEVSLSDEAQENP